MEYPKSGLKKVFFRGMWPVSPNKETDYWVPEMGTTGRFLDNGVFVVGHGRGIAPVTILPGDIRGWIADPPPAPKPKPKAKPAPRKKPAARRTRKPKPKTES